MKTVRSSAWIAGIASLALMSACGSTQQARSTGKRVAAAAATTTTKAKSAAAHDMSAMGKTVVTDLSGHVITGVKAHDVTMEMGPDKVLSHATHALLAKQLVEARTVAMRYPTVAAAEAGGYHLVGGEFGPGSGAHYIGGYGAALGSFDATHPLALIYDGTSPTSVMVGLMYYGMGDTAPQGFAGPNDHWHRHSGICLGSGSTVLFPPDSSVTEAQCSAVHGSFMSITGWMVHAWVVPGWESPAGVFSHENPNLRCADGTFHTDKIGGCKGS